MARKRIGALTIGQSPRPDLVAPLVHMMPDCEIVQAGALDDLTPDELPSITDLVYPLVTQLHNGVGVMVDESFVAPKLQQAQIRLEAKGVAATLLLCAGTFSALSGTRPIYKPFTIGRAVLGALNVKTIGVIVPILEQEVAAEHRWKRVGWEPTVWTADLGNQDRAFYRKLISLIDANGLECIVLDYFGHPVEHVNQLKKSIKQPVIDLGYLAIVALASTL